jgi:thioredoxin 1
MQTSEQNSKESHSNVMKISTIEQFDSMLTLNDKVIVDFYAEWCKPCKKLSPIFNEYASNTDFHDIVFCSVDIDQNPDIAEQCEVLNLPTVLFYKTLENTDELVGFNQTSLAQLDTKIKKLLYEK